MKNVDYYVELGVPKAATPSEIRQAFKALARRYHPDRNPDDISTQERFQRITEAYEVLSDPEKRQQYDRLGPLYQLDKAPPTADETVASPSEFVPSVPPTDVPSPHQTPEQTTTAKSHFEEIFHTPSAIVMTQEQQNAAIRYAFANEETLPQGSNPLCLCQ